MVLQVWLSLVDGAVDVVDDGAPPGGGGAEVVGGANLGGCPILVGVYPEVGY